jgi:hypothetical protein
MSAAGWTIKSEVDVEHRNQLEAVSESLWRQRHLLSRLLFKLAIVRAVLAAEAYTWLTIAADETGEILDELETLEWHDPGRVARPVPAAPAPAPWDTILGEHRAALGVLRRQAHTVAEATMKNLFEGADAIAAEVARLEAEEDILGGRALLLAWCGLRRDVARAARRWSDGDLN